MYKYGLKDNKTKNSLRSFQKQYIVGEMSEVNILSLVNEAYIIRINL